MIAPTLARRLFGANISPALGRAAWLCVGLLAGGCNQAPPNATQEGVAASGGAPRPATMADVPPRADVPPQADPHGDQVHEHVPGAHGGVIASLGRNSYHVEAVVETGGVLRLYTLGADETRVQEVETQTLKGFVKAEGAAAAQAFELQPEPQEGDAPDTTSLFVGRLPAEVEGLPLEVTIPSIRIAGERFRIGFSTATDHAAHGDDDMPAKVADDAERELYLTPAGLYTAADVAANGNRTASEKFRSFRAKHDMNPQSGDQVCPITMTKANPECTWIVGGKEYSFCCPPCVDEFVAWAKNPETADKVRNPEDYVKP